MKGLTKEQVIQYFDFIPRYRLQDEVDDILGGLSTSQAEKLKSEIYDLENEVEGLESDVQDKDQEIEDLQDEVWELEQKLEKLEEEKKSE